MANAVQVCIRKAFLLASPVALVVAALAGCGSDSSRPLKTSPVVRAPKFDPARSVLVGQFIADVNPAEKKMTFRAVPMELPPSVQAALGTKSSVTIPVDKNGTAGTTGTSNAVELVTTFSGLDSACGAGKANVFCADVTARHFFASGREPSNVWVNVADIKVGATSVTTHNATNADTQNPHGFTTSKGRWAYDTSGNVDDGSLGRWDGTATLTGFNQASRRWEFRDDAPHTESWSAKFDVYYSPDFESYGPELGPLTVDESLDACTLAGSSTINPNLLGIKITAPFNFTLFNTTPGTNATDLHVYRHGFLKVGSAGTNQSANVDLTVTNTAAAPGVFAYWDNLQPATAVHPDVGMRSATQNGGNTGKVCYVTQGTEPNRYFIVTWHDYEIRTADGSAWDTQTNVTFSMIFWERVNRLDFVYIDLATNLGNIMIDGDGQTIGMQNVDRAKVSQYSYGSGDGSMAGAIFAGLDLHFRPTIF